MVDGCQIAAHPGQRHTRGRGQSNAQPSWSCWHRLSRNTAECRHNQPVHRDGPCVVGCVFRVHGFIHTQWDSGVAQPRIREVIDPDRAPTGIRHHRPEHRHVGGALAPAIRKRIGRGTGRIRPIMVAAQCVPPLVHEAQGGKATRVDRRKGIRLETRRRHGHQVRQPATGGVLIHQRDQIRPHLIPQGMHLVHDSVRLPLQRCQSSPHRSRLDVGHLPQMHQGEPHRNLAVRHRRIRIRHRLQDLGFDTRRPIAHPGCRRVDHHHVDHPHPAITCIQYWRGPALRASFHNDRLDPHGRTPTLPMLERQVAPTRGRSNLIELVSGGHGPIDHTGNHSPPPGKGRTAQWLSGNPSSPHPISSRQFGGPLTLQPERLSGEQSHIKTSLRQHRGIHRHRADPVRHGFPGHRPPPCLRRGPHTFRRFCREGDHSGHRQPHHDPCHPSDQTHDPRNGRPALAAAFHRQSSSVFRPLHSGELPTGTLQQPRTTTYDISLHKCEGKPAKLVIAISRSIVSYIINCLWLPRLPNRQVRSLFESP